MGTGFHIHNFDAVPTNPSLYEANNLLTPFEFINVYYDVVNKTLHLILKIYFVAICILMKMNVHNFDNTIY